MEERITPVRTYLIVGFLLCALAATTIALSFVNLHGWNPVVALAIAGIKATLILLFFMELRFSGGIVRLALLAALFWLLVILMGTLDDVLTRGWLPVPGK